MAYSTGVKNNVDQSVNPVEDKKLMNTGYAE